MIQITVTGDTYPVRRMLKNNHFGWDGKTWRKTVAEADLNRTLESIRPPVSWSDEPSPKVTITLGYVGIHGNQINEGKDMRINLMPVGARGGVDFLSLFLDETGVQIITTHTVPANAECGRGVRT